MPRRTARSLALPTHAVLYARVSTRHQTASGLGLAAQQAKCRDHAARLGLAVLCEYRDEGISGSEGLSDRPGLAEAIRLTLDTPGAILIAYSLSRLARRQRLVWHILDDREGLGVPFSSASEPFDTASPMGRAMLGVLAVWAQLESDLVSERTIDALAVVREQGVKLGQMPMLERYAGHRKREIDPAKVALIRRIQELYATGNYSHRSLAEFLNREGVRTATGRGRWSFDTVRKALACRLPTLPIAAPQSPPAPRLPSDLGYPSSPLVNVGSEATPLAPVRLLDGVRGHSGGTLVEGG